MNGLSIKLDALITILKGVAGEDHLRVPRAHKEFQSCSQQCPGFDSQVWPESHKCEHR